jgi:hypothetical protein
MTGILEESLQLVQSKLDRINCPVWINADIVNGPQLFNNFFDSFKVVDPDTFLSLSDKYVPEATVSPGRKTL